MIVKENDLTGKNLSNYKITGKLGRGGMATVYKAHEKSLNRVVALKVLSDQLSEDKDYIKRFQREAQAAAQLNHPNIVQVYAIGEEDGHHYFAMEYIKGKSLAEIKKDVGDLTPAEGVALIKQVADALSDAHRVGLVHRDIKPSNIMIDATGRAKVTDFGIAYVSTAQTKLTREGSIIGTPEYLSPEQCEGKTVDQRSDIYSLGVTLYELLTGKTPYEADTPVSMLMKIVKGDFPPIQEIKPNVPKQLRDIVEKMMETDPNKRYASMNMVIDDLNSFEKAQESPAVPAAGAVPADAGNKMPPTATYQEVEARPQQDSTPKNNKMAAFVVAAVIMLLLGGAFAAKVLYFDKVDQEKQASEPAGTELETKTEEIAGDYSTGTETAETTTNQPSDRTGKEQSPENQPDESSSEMTAGMSTTGKHDTQQGVTAEAPITSSGKTSAHTGGATPIQTGTAASPTAKRYTPGTSAASSPMSGKTPVKKTPVVTGPPARSCLITPIGDDSGLITPYVQAFLTKRNFKVMDGPSVSDKEIAKIARNHIVVSVKSMGSSTLEYYGNSTEQYTVRLTVKLVAASSGRIAAGPYSETVRYTSLNAEDNLKEAVSKLMTRLQSAIQ